MWNVRIGLKKGMWNKLVTCSRREFVCSLNLSWWDFFSLQALWEPYTYHWRTLDEHGYTIYNTRNKKEVSVRVDSGHIGFFGVMVARGPPLPSLSERQHPWSVITCAQWHLTHIATHISHSHVHFYKVWHKWRNIDRRMKNQEQPTTPHHISSSTTTTTHTHTHHYETIMLT